MIDPQRSPMKNAALWFVIACFGIVTAYLFFVGIISVWVGFFHFDQDGSGIPILGGMILMFLILWFFFRLTR
ncbi:MAG: hypothetical protein ABII06_09775, partial [Pseudomonadota bacterium]